jgi:Zn-finger nucleic acid-binding protein
MRKLPNDISDDIISSDHTGDTWNTCPRCGKEWKDATSTPGVIHKTRYCATCCMRSSRGNQGGHKREPKL